jgi:hypothetical protein
LSFQKLCPIWDKVFKKWPELTRVQKELAVTHLNFSETSCAVAEAHNHIEYDCKECLAFASWDFTFVIEPQQMTIRKELLQEITERFVKHMKKEHPSRRLSHKT